MVFTRKFNDTLVKNLIKEDLFIKKLLPDIESGNVFPAIRNNEMHFYYKGGRLFKYTNSGFESNIKHVSVVGVDIDGDINERELGTLRLIENFTDGYHRIKENCEKYSSKEAKCVSNLFKYSYAKTNKINEIVLLDIEVSFENENDNEEFTQDRIDILLFNNITNSLKFYEAKLFSNSQIRSRTTPEVIPQINRYNNQLETNRQVIIEQYRNYRNIVNTLFGLNLNEPESLVENVTLLVTDFDNNQQNSPELQHLRLVCNGNDPNINCYSKGKTSDIKIETLWKK